MNEQEQVSQLSALFDNELPPAQAEMVVRRALRDPALRESWGRYALIGACLRGEPVSAGLKRPDVAERVRQRLSAEVEHAHGTASLPAAANARRPLAIFGRGALGGAIAAGVALVSLVLVRSFTPAAGGASTQIAQVSPQPVPRMQVAVASRPVESTPVAARDGALPSYTTPVNNLPAGQRLSGPLVNYVVAHSEVAASAVRFSPMTSVVSGEYDITDGTVEMTPEEIGAHRR